MTKCICPDVQLQVVLAAIACRWNVAQRNLNPAKQTQFFHPPLRFPSKSTNNTCANHFFLCLWKANVAVYFPFFPVCIISTAMAIFCKSFCRVLRKHLPKFAKCSIIQRHQQRRNNICGCGEIGRRAWFRFMWETMQVQVLSSAPKRGHPLWSQTTKGKRTTLALFCFLLLVGHLGYRCTECWNNVTFAQLTIPSLRSLQVLSSAPKKSYHFDTTFFIQTAGLVYPFGEWRATPLLHHALACISSALWAVYHHSSECIFLRFDYIQCFALMIYRNKLRMIYTFCESDFL